MFKCLAALDPSDQSRLHQLATYGNIVFIAAVKVPVYPSTSIHLMVRLSILYENVD